MFALDNKPFFLLLYKLSLVLRFAWVEHLHFIVKYETSNQRPRNIIFVFFLPLTLPSVFYSFRVFSYPRFLWVSSLAYPNLLGTKEFVVVGGGGEIRDGTYNFVMLLFDCDYFLIFEITMLHVNDEC
jgi:hypothetical protein